LPIGTSQKGGLVGYGYRLLYGSAPVRYVVLYVPKLACSLFSVCAAIKRGNQVRFGQEKCRIRGSSGQLHGIGTLVERLYQLDCEVRSAVGEHASAAVLFGINNLVFERPTVAQDGTGTVKPSVRDQDV
jgi:hypothetical protein